MSGFTSGSDMSHAVTLTKPCTLRSQYSAYLGTKHFWRTPSSTRYPLGQEVEVPHANGAKTPWSYLVFSLKSDEVGRESGLQRYFNFDPVDVHSKEHFEVMQNVGKWQESAQMFFIVSSWNDLAQAEDQVKSFVELSAADAFKESVLLIVNKEDTVLPFAWDKYSDHSLSRYKGSVNKELKNLCAATASRAPKEKGTSIPTAQTQIQRPVDDNSRLSLVLQHIEDCEDPGDDMRSAKAELEAQLASWRHASASQSTDPHKPALKTEWTPIPSRIVGTTESGRSALAQEVSRLSTAPVHIIFGDQDEIHVRRPYNQYSFSFGRQAIVPLGSQTQRKWDPNRQADFLGGSARQGAPTHHAPIVVTSGGWADTTTAEGTGRPGASDVPTMVRIKQEDVM